MPPRIFRRGRLPERIRWPVDRMIFWFAPRQNPRPAPVPGVFDAPCTCLRINKEWASHVLGALQVLDDDDSWTGDDDERHRALTEIAKLMSAVAIGDPCMCCCGDSSTPKTPTNQRFNPTTNRLEVSYDNGQTWETDPNDARFNTPLLPPVPGEPGDEKQCQAASNVVDALKRSVEFMIETVGAGNNAFEVLVLVVGFVASLIGVIFSGGLAIPAALAAAAVLLQSIYNLITSYGIAAFTAAFTQDEWDIALCVIYCNTRPDGSYTQTDWNAIMTDLHRDLAYKSQVATSLANFINSYGPAGLNNIARSRSVTAGDCEVCADCDNSCAADDQTDYFTRGNVLSVTGNFVRVQAVLETPPTGDPYYLVMWGEYGVIGSKCCYIPTITVFSGVFLNNAERTECDGTVVSQDPALRSQTHFSLYSDEPFTVDIEFPAP